MSAASVSQGSGRYELDHSTPNFRLGGLASVSPESPANVSSDSERRYHSDSVLASPGRIAVRRPSSAPTVRTRSGTCAGGFAGSGPTVTVAPRASLLWKPVPKSTYSSVLAQGPNVRVALGLTMAAALPPEFAAVSLATSIA